MLYLGKEVEREKKETKKRSSHWRKGDVFHGGMRSRWAKEGQKHKTRPVICTCQISSHRGKSKVVTRRQVYVADHEAGVPILPTLHVGQNLQVKEGHGRREIRMSNIRC